MIPFSLCVPTFFCLIFLKMSSPDAMHRGKRPILFLFFAPCPLTFFFTSARYAITPAIRKKLKRESILESLGFILFFLLSWTIPELLILYLKDYNIVDQLKFYTFEIPGKTNKINYAIKLRSS